MAQPISVKQAFLEGNLNVYSAYLFDTLKFGEQWLLNLGVRNDYTDGQYRSDKIETTNWPCYTWHDLSAVR